MLKAKIRQFLEQSYQLKVCVARQITQTFNKLATPLGVVFVTDHIERKYIYIPKYAAPLQTASFDRN